MGTPNSEIYSRSHPTDPTRMSRIYEVGKEVGHPVYLGDRTVKMGTEISILDNKTQNKWGVWSITGIRDTNHGIQLVLRSLEDDKESRYLISALEKDPYGYVIGNIEEMRRKQLEDMSDLGDSGVPLGARRAVPQYQEVEDDSPAPGREEKETTSSYPTVVPTVKEGGRQKTASFRAIGVDDTGPYPAAAREKTPPILGEKITTIHELHKLHKLYDENGNLTISPKDLQTLKDPDILPETLGDLKYLIDIKTQQIERRKDFIKNMVVSRWFGLRKIRPEFAPDGAIANSRQLEEALKKQGLVGNLQSLQDYRKERNKLLSIKRLELIFQQEQKEGRKTSEGGVIIERLEKHDKNRQILVKGENKQILVDEKYAYHHENIPPGQKECHFLAPNLATIDGRTDQGGPSVKKPLNEDSMLVVLDEEGNLGVAVIDGSGGTKGTGRECPGYDANRIANQSICDTLKSGADIKTVMLAADRAIKIDPVWTKGKKGYCVAAVMKVESTGKEARIGWAGDASALIFRKGEIIHRAMPQNIPSLLAVKAGKRVTHDVVYREKNSHQITTVLGSLPSDQYNKRNSIRDRFDTPQEISFRSRKGDIVILYSDGFVSLLSELEIETYVREYGDNPKRLQQELFMLAYHNNQQLEAGDNITVMVVKLQ